MTSLTASFDRLGGSLRRSGKVVGDIGRLVQQQIILDDIVSDQASFIERVGISGADPASLEGEYLELQNKRRSIGARIPSLRGEIGLLGQKVDAAFRKLKLEVAYRTVAGRADAILTKVGLNALDISAEGENSIARKVLGDKDGNIIGDGHVLFQNVRDVVKDISDRTGSGLSPEQLDRLAAYQMLNIIIDSADPENKVLGFSSSVESWVEYLDNVFTSSEKSSLLGELRLLNPELIGKNINVKNFFRDVSNIRILGLWRTHRSVASNVPARKLPSQKEFDALAAYGGASGVRHTVEHASIVSSAYADGTKEEKALGFSFLEQNSGDMGLMSLWNSMITTPGKINLTLAFLGERIFKPSAENVRLDPSVKKQYDIIQSRVDVLTSDAGIADRQFQYGGLDAGGVEIMAYTQAVIERSGVPAVDVGKRLSKTGLLRVKDGGGVAIFRSFPDAPDDSIANTLENVVVPAMNRVASGRTTRGLNEYGEENYTADMIRLAIRLQYGDRRTDGNRTFLWWDADKDMRNAQPVDISGGGDWEVGGGDLRVSPHNNRNVSTSVSGLGIQSILGGNSVPVPSDVYELMKDGGLVRPYVPTKILEKTNIQVQAMAGGDIDDIAALRLVKDLPDNEGKRPDDRYFGDNQSVRNVAVRTGTLIVNSTGGYVPNLFALNMEVMDAAAGFIREQVDAGLANTKSGQLLLERLVSEKYDAFYAFETNEYNEVNVNPHVTNVFTGDEFRKLLDDGDFRVIQIIFPGSSR